MWGNIEILNLSQQKEEDTIWCQNQIFNYKVFHRKFISNKNEKIEIIINKPVYYGISILELNKILMYEFWYDYIKLKYGKKAKLCYMYTDSFIVYIKTDNIYKDVAEDVATRFDSSNYELGRPLPKGKNEKVIGLMKDELGRKIMTKFVRLRAKACI